MSPKASFCWVAEESCRNVAQSGWNAHRDAFRSRCTWTKRCWCFIRYLRKLSGAWLNSTAPSPATLQDPAHPSLESKRQTGKMILCTNCKLQHRINVLNHVVCECTLPHVWFHISTPKSERFPAPYRIPNIVYFYNGMFIHLLCWRKHCLCTFLCTISLPAR